MHSRRILFVLSCALLSTSAAVAQTVITTDTSLLGVDDAAFTPNGDLVVVRDNTLSTSSRVYDARSGQILATISGAGGPVSGAAHDAVEVTNDRGVVLGSTCRVLDLTNLQVPVLASYDLGKFPRDLAITPNGSQVAIRGGDTDGFSVGGLFVLDLATGNLVASAPGEPAPWAPDSVDFDVDSVVVTDQHAVFVSSVGVLGTRVTVMDLQPAQGGPVVSYETGPGSDADLLGIPHDLAITPDGQHAVVRSELAVALFRLTGGPVQLSWSKRLHGNPGPFGGSAMDSVEVTNDRIATISRVSNGGIGAQVDIFDLAGTQRWDRIEGDPHDLAINPSGKKLLVRTHTHVHMYNLQNINNPGEMNYLSRRPQLSTHTWYGAGMDSLELTEDRAVTVARVDESATIKFWDISGPNLQNLGTFDMSDRPVDVAITPGGEKVVISGFTHFMAFDLRTVDLLMDFDPLGLGGYPWSDGVVTNGATAIAMGSRFNLPAGTGVSGGWLTLVDLFEQPTVYCNSGMNSTGGVGGIYATGSASVARNDLRLVATDLPRNRLGCSSMAMAKSMRPSATAPFAWVGRSLPSTCSKARRTASPCSKWTARPCPLEASR